MAKGKTIVITSQKSFPGSGSQTLFSAKQSDRRKYVCVRRLRAKQVDCLLTFGYVQGIPPTRAQAELEKCNHLLDAHWSIPIRYMLDYNFAVEYHPGRENISDYTSRHPVPLQKCTKFELRATKEVKRYVNYVVTCNTPNAFTKEQVQKATDEDPTLLALRGCIHKGWIEL